MNKINNVNSWNGWDPLEQVVLGNCYNPSFFEPVKDSRTRELLQQLLYETQEDLANFKRCMEMEGVDVIQIKENTTRSGSVINTIEDEWAIIGSDSSARMGGIAPPMLTPRDDYITLGNKIVSVTSWKSNRDLIADYMENPDVDLVSPFYDAFPNQRGKQFSAPCITRLGKRVIIDDEGIGSAENADFLMSHFPEFDVVSHTVGGHNDGCFCPMKPGQVISTTWVSKSDYRNTLPGWNIEYIKDKRYYDTMSNRTKFNRVLIKRKSIDKMYWHPAAKENIEFTNYIDSWLNEWVGYSIESIFEVNMLVINPELVFCPTFDENIFRYIEKIGMTPVHVPFRHRHFWDGGLHCLTLDTRRRGEQQDYWK